VITQYDIATLVRLPRNKLTLLGACVTGQGVDLGGGEVSGFLRSFMAAGCGALAVTLWPVLDEAIVDVAGSLLRAIKTGMNGPVDLVQKLFQASLARCKKVDGARERLEACPVVLYL
jgi:hypothetical protein